MKKFICTYFIFMVAGAMPPIIADYSVCDWRWWAVLAPLWLGIYLHRTSVLMD